MQLRKKRCLYLFVAIVGMVVASVRLHPTISARVDLKQLRALKARAHSLTVWSSDGSGRERDVSEWEVVIETDDLLGF